MGCISRVSSVVWLVCLLTIGMPVEASIDSTHLQQWKLHLDNRFSSVKSSPLSSWGVSVGRIWGRFDREVTLGYYWLGKRGTRQLFEIERQQAPFSGYYPQSRLGVVSAGYWHIITNTRRWKVGFPIEIGVGRAHSEFISAQGDGLPVPAGITTTVVPLQVGSYVEWKATRWVGVGLQSGYRWNLRAVSPPTTLNGLYYRIRVLVYPVAIREGLRFLFRGEPLPSPFFKKSEIIPLE
jgi:hypothetical protein